MDKVYIAGPMRGIPEFNREEFAKAERMLKWTGKEVVNPWQLDVDDGMDMSSPSGDTSDIEGFNDESMKDIIRKYVELLISCDAIFMLNGWEDSKGASAEYAVAQWMGLEVLNYIEV